MRDTPLEAKKILFAPHEIGGQMQLMAQELRRRGYYATSATYNQEWFGHVNDIHLSVDKTNSKVRKHLVTILFSLWAAANYDIFHFFWGSSLYGTKIHPHLDLPFLKRMGKKIFVHFRGLDLIDLKYFDYLRGKTAGDTVQEPPISRPDQLRSLQLWQKHADRLIVYGPDMLRVAPGAAIIQQAINLDNWRPERDYPMSKEDGIIRIAHAPSLRRKKGTEFVQRSIEELKSKGYRVELVLIENVPYSQIKPLYESADIGIDQVLYGWYGKVSLELMALGRPVICYIDDEWGSYRLDLPIVSASPLSLTTKLEELVCNEQLRRELGTCGPEYVCRHHDVRVIVDQCLELYQESLR